MDNIVFVGGIHGVGKGKICAEIADKSNLIHLTASQVIKWTQMSTGQNKFVENLSETQDVLITNLRQIIEEEKKYLLDGHYCLLNKTGEPEKIPMETFTNINPKKLIVVYEDIMVIKERLQERDSKIYDEQILKKFQDLEISYAEEISQTFNIPLLKVRSTANDNINEIKNYIQ